MPLASRNSFFRLLEAMNSALGMTIPGIVLAAWLCPGSSFAVDGAARDVQLIVIVSVDQMRSEYVERFAPLFRGGLKLLMDSGRIYTDAHQDHAVTLTGAGHASILSGSHPARNGIVGNSWYDRKRKRVVYCAEDPASGARGPGAMKVDTLGDWMRKLDSRSKVFAFSGKDRSAILMAGRRPKGVFWFDPDAGGFVSSRYYPRTPRWIKSFNKQKLPGQYLGVAWNRLLKDRSIYDERSTADKQAGEGGDPTFPHWFSGKKADKQFHSNLFGTPFMDEVVLRFAESAIREEKLGQRKSLDLLALGLSSTDYVGHRYGPDSHEIQDTILRLDQYLGSFFQFLETTVGKDRFLIVLTSDHGVQSLPEVLESRGVDGRRILGALQELLGRVVTYLGARFGEGPWIAQFLNNSIYFDLKTARKRKVSREDLEQRVAQILRASDLIQDVFTRTELLSGNPHETAYTPYFVHSFHESRSGDVFFQFKKNYLVVAPGGGTTHGTPYRYDTHVPLIFAGPGIIPARIQQRAATIDIAPTLAKLLEIPIPHPVDGHPLF